MTCSGHIAKNIPVTAAVDPAKPAKKAKAPHRGGVRGFQDGRFGGGRGLAVRLMSGQRMDGRYRGDFANSSNGLQQCVSAFAGCLMRPLPPKPWLFAAGLRCIFFRQGCPEGQAVMDGDGDQQDR